MDEKLSKLILDYAQGFLNCPYRWAGANPMTGFDCSGLVIEILKARAVVPNSFDATAHVLYQRSLDGGTLKPKAHCLAFYGKGNIATHVGYCISDTHMIEAGAGNVLTTSLEAAAKQNAFVRIRPIFYRKDFIAVHEVTREQFL